MSSCTIEDRFALFYLLTCPKSNITGSYSIIPRIAAAEIGWDTESQFLRVLRRLADSGFIKYDTETGFVWVRIWWEHHHPKVAMGPMLYKKTIKQIREMPSSWISEYLDDLLIQLQEYQDPKDSRNPGKTLTDEFSPQDREPPDQHPTDRVSIPHREPMARPVDDYSSQISGENTKTAIHPEAEGSRRGKPEGHAQENRVSVPYLSHIPRGAGNYNPNNNYKNNNTTTDRLIFPHDLSRAAQASIEEALLQVSDTDAQKLLDELAAAIASKKVKTTITQLFHGLLKNYHQGKLQPSSGAIAIANKRLQNGGVGQEAIATLKRKMLIN